MAYLSFLNVIAAIAVIILHANGSFWGYRSGAEWKMNNVLECLFFFAVPVFFMLSGATLLDYRDRYDTKTFLQKRLSKTFIPFLFWSLFALVIKIFSAESPKDYFRGAMNFEKIFNGIFNTEYQDVFWFFIPLFCIYLSIPLLSAIPKEEKIPVFAFTAAAAGIFNVVLPFLFALINRFGGLNFKYIFQIPVISGYLLYVLLGYLLHRVELQLPYRIGIYCAGLAGLLTHLLGTQILSDRAGFVDGFFKGYLNLPCVLYSVAVFVLVKYGVMRIRNEKLIRFVSFVQKYTFEFYLMHKFIFMPLNFLLEKVNIHFGSLPSILLLTVLTIPLCILITFLLRKIPVVKNIVP